MWYSFCEHYISLLTAIGRTARNGSYVLFSSHPDMTYYSIIEVYYLIVSLQWCLVCRLCIKIMYIREDIIERAEGISLYQSRQTSIII